MADIELVIKIPEELKNKIDNANEDNYRTYLWWFETTLYCAIKDGIPLPKGHGRLIDADVFEKRLMDARSYYIGEKADDFDLRFASGLKSAAERLVDAPTIIEAESEDNNDGIKELS